MLLNELANASTNLLISNNVISYKQTDIYIYGFEIFYSTLFSMLGILLSSILFSSWINGIIFLLYFMPIRIFAGGYHASTYGKCFVLTNIAFLITVVVTNILMVTHFSIRILTLLVSIAYIIKHAPIENQNAPLTSQKRRKNMVYARRCILIECVSILLWFLLGVSQVAVMGIATTAMVSFMMMITNNNIHISN